MHPLPEHTVTGVAYSFRKYCFPRRKGLPLSTNELRKPSTTHSNADLLIWSLYLLGGVEKWINAKLSAGALFYGFAPVMNALCVIPGEQIMVTLNFENNMAFVELIDEDAT